MFTINENFLNYQIVRDALKSCGVRWEEGRGVLNRDFHFDSDEETYRNVLVKIDEDKTFMQTW